MRGYDIIGYVYKADTWCPPCVVQEVCRDYSIKEAPIGTTFETELEALANILDIDYEDEHSYDTDNFPKVIFASSYEGEVCAKCGEALLETI